MLARRFILAALAALIACDDSPTQPDLAPAELRLAPLTAESLAVGDTLRLFATVKNRSGAFVQAAVTWRSSAPATAAVDGSGLVIALQPGAAYIRATSGSAADSVRIVVTPAESLSLSVLAPAAARQGDAVELFAVVTQAGGEIDTVRNGVEWRVLDEAAGIVDPGGRFVGYQPGTSARVVARSGALADTATIGVQPRGLSGSLTPIGLGRVQGRITSDLWVWRAADDRDYALTGTWGCAEACGNRVYAWDVTDPAAIVMTDSVALVARTVNDVKVSADGRFAVATHEGEGQGVSLLSLADPAHPSVITHYTQGLANGVHNVWIERLQGRDYVFTVADGSSAAGGLRIIDVTDALAGTGAPVQVAQYYAGTSFVHDVYVRDGLAFVSHWSAGLIVLDVGHGIRGGTPAAPVEVSRAFIPGCTAGALGGCEIHNAWYWPATGYIFIGQERFVSSDPGRVHVIDARDLEHPVYVASYTIPQGDPPHNFWLDEAEAVLFIGWYDHGLRAIDVAGTLLGELERQGREFAASPALTTAGSSSGVWAPQLHHGTVFASEMLQGLRAFRFEANR